MALRRFSSFVLFSALLLPVSAWAQEVAMEAAETVAAHPAAEEGGSMPQLDPTYYPSQLFWLLICGVVLYVVMAKVALPRVARMVNMRDDQVRHDLEYAHRLRQEAEDIKLVYTRSLRDADERAKTLANRVTQEMKDKQADALAKIVTQVNKKVTETEQYLRGEKDVLMNDAPQIAQRLSQAIMQELKKAA